MSSSVPRICLYSVRNQKTSCPEDKLLLLFCLDCKEPLPLLEDNLLSFFSDLLLEELAAGVLHVISALRSQ